VRRVRLEDLLASPDELSRLRDLLARGGVAAIPTETFYGLAADPMNERGVSRIFEIKGRDDGKPLLVLFSDREQLSELLVDGKHSRLDPFFRIWPAPLTVVVPIRRAIAASRGGGTLAIRIPALPEARNLLRAVGPLTGTSANRSGAEPMSSPDAVGEALGSDLDLLVDGGTTSGGAPSTIVDATVDPPRLLRAGACAWPPPRG
jgi:L-threonylcarbamoyladenylate synthase